MKKDYVFIATAMVTGLVAAIMTMAVLGAIAIPAYKNYILTPAELSDLDMSASRFMPVFEHADYLTIPIVLLLTIALVLLLRAINPNFRWETIKLKPGLYKAIVVIAAAVVVGVLYPVANGLTGIATLLASSILMGCCWMIIGEMGWAGDFSSWGPATRERGPEFIKCFVYGAIQGAVMAGLFSYADWAFSRYMTLVSEVLDGSGETSYRGFELLFYGLAVLFILISGILAALALSLSPSVKTNAERIKNFSITLILMVVFFATTYGIYSYAADKYDLGTSSLAEAAGIPDKSTLNNRILYLSSLDNRDKFLLADLPLNASGFSIAGNSSIAVSSDNLRKVEQYLDDHPDGTVHKYSALEVIYNGYFALFDIEAADRALLSASAEQIVPRHILIRRLSILPVTAGNINLAKEFADENKWVARGRSAHQLSMAFAHLGLVDEARAWEAKAIKDGYKIEKPAIPQQEPVLTKGTINGNLKLNGTPLADGRVAIMRAFDKPDELKISGIYNGLVAVSKLDSNGRFSFERLGGGKYYLLLIDNKSLAGDDIQPANLSVKGNTGVINLDYDHPKMSLGTIRVEIKQSGPGSGKKL